MISQLRSLGPSISIFDLQHGLLITARQYGEVVLHDASTGQGPGTLARKLSRCKVSFAKASVSEGGYGALFAFMVQVLLSAGAFAVQF
jgi:hypothetical protein